MTAPAPKSPERAERIPESDEVRFYLMDPQALHEISQEVSRVLEADKEVIARELSEKYGIPKNVLDEILRDLPPPDHEICKGLAPNLFATIVAIITSNKHADDGPLIGKENDGFREEVFSTILRCYNDYLRGTGVINRKIPEFLTLDSAIHIALNRDFYREGLLAFEGDLPNEVKSYLKLFALLVEVSRKGKVFPKPNEKQLLEAKIDYLHWEIQREVRFSRALCMITIPMLIFIIVKELWWLEKQDQDERRAVILESPQTPVSKPTFDGATIDFPCFAYLEENGEIITTPVTELADVLSRATAQTLTSQPLNSYNRNDWAPALAREGFGTLIHPSTEEQIKDFNQDSRLDPVYVDDKTTRGYLLPGGYFESSSNAYFYITGEVDLNGNRIRYQISPSRWGNPCRDRGLTPERGKTQWKMQQGTLRLVVSD